MTIVWMPFVYAVLARPDRRYRPRWTWAADRLVVDVADATSMPEPAIIIHYPWEQGLKWYAWEGDLVRPVVLEDRLASVREIEDAVELVQPRAAEPWFADHPGASRVLPDQDEHWRHGVRHGLLIHRSEKTRRTRALLQLLEASFVHDLNLHCPAHVPTWRVGLNDGQHINITLQAAPAAERQPIGFHFPLDRKDAAIAFAEKIGGRRRELTSDGVEASWTPQTFLGDAALETALSMAGPILQRMSMDTMTTSSGHLAPLLGALKALHDNRTSRYGTMLGHGEDGIFGGINATDVLHHIESADFSELMPEIVELQRCLRVRREILSDFDAHVLANLKF
jgi:hypothetical protein